MSVRAIGLAGCIGLMFTAACGTDDDGAFVDHDESADFDPFDGSKADGVSSVFVRNNILDDALFGASFGFLDAAGVQQFLEVTPYARRCFLADAKLGDQTAAEAIVAAAQAHEINPLLLLVRMQVEKGLISKSTAPSQKSIDFAFGCGCADGRACNEAFRGFAKQLDCAATTMRKHFDDATGGSGIWNVGVPKQTLDKLTVAPENAATASMYAYTPWVLEGRGGNWLVWNISGKYLADLENRGLIGELSDAGFVGTPCDPDDLQACGYTVDGDEGYCHGFSRDGELFGVCSLDCEGLCPDRGAVETLCVELDAGRGSCMPLAASSNEDCAAIPGTEPTEMDRFVGQSGASAKTAVVCAPSGGSIGGGPSCVGKCGSTSAVPDGQGNACFCDPACVQEGDCCPDYADVCE